MCRKFTYEFTYECMADYAAEIKVWLNGEAKREEITNYDKVQDYLRLQIETLIGR